MGSFGIYSKLIGISIQTQLQYRSSLAMQTIGQFVMFTVEFIAIAGLFSRFGSIAGWRLGEAALLFGFADLCFACSDALARGFDQLGSQIKSGDFDRVLARPVSPFAQILGQELTLRRFGRLLEGALVFALGWYMTGPTMSAIGAIALVMGFAGAVTVFVSIETMQGALSFWTVEGLEIVNAISYGGRQVSSYPMRAYREFIRRFFLFAIPIGLTIYVPLCALLMREPFPDWPWWIGAITPLAAIPFAAIAALAWKAGVSHYESAGG